MDTPKPVFKNLLPIIEKKTIDDMRFQASLAGRELKDAPPQVTMKNKDKAKKALSDFIKEKKKSWQKTM